MVEVEVVGACGRAGFDLSHASMSGSGRGHDDAAAFAEARRTGYAVRQPAGRSEGARWVVDEWQRRVE